MKKIISSIIGIVCFIGAFAQNADYGRISIYPIQPEIENVPEAARKLLESKLGSIVTSYGIASAGTDRFVITSQVSILERNIIPTNPVKIQQKVQITIQIGDLIERRVYSSSVITLTGIGVTDEKSFISAFSRIHPQNDDMERMVEQAKNGIINYYTDQCPAILKDAEAKANLQQYTEALTMLALVPNVCTNCYNESRDLALTIYTQQIDTEAKKILQEAKSAWALKKDYQCAYRALELLWKINPQSNYAAEAGAFAQQIDKKLRTDEAQRHAEQVAKEKRDWDFRMQQYNDSLYSKRLNDTRAHERSMQLTEQVLAPLAHHVGPFVSLKRSIF